MGELCHILVERALSLKVQLRVLNFLHPYIAWPSTTHRISQPLSKIGAEVLPFFFYFVPALGETSLKLAFTELTIFLYWLIK